jgi:hypothetical protein
MPVTSILRITRHPYEEPHCVNLVVQASTDGCSAELEIYANAEDLTRAAEALAAFLRPDREFKWELGSERPEDRFAFYFLLRVWQVSAGGRCAAGVRFSNNRYPPDRRVAELSWLVDPADVDRLASCFREFSKLSSDTMEWVVGPR